MISFGAKYWIFLMWLIPFLWVLGFYLNQKKLKKIKSFFGKNSFKFLTSSLSLKKREWKRVLECLALFFLIFALMQPQWGKSLKKIKSHGIELVILFDVSKSMLAEDVKPNRLEFAKREVIRFLNLSKGDQIGLLAFAGSSILLSPLTSDYSALKMYVESLNTNSISTQGTNYGKALLEAKNAFKRGGIQSTKNDIVTRALLIVSDGEDNEKGISSAIQELKEEKIYIFSLLFGTEKGGVIPLKDSLGRVLSYQKDNSGKVVLTKAKGDLLKSLSLKGKGSFYHATYGGRAPFNVRADIEKLQKTEFEEKNQMDLHERYQIFLLFGLLIALIELLLSEKKKSRKKWLGRFVPFSLTLFLFFIPQNGKTNIKVILKNNKGAQSLVQGKTQKAKNHFLNALKEEPLNPLHHFHLGITFEQEGEIEKAIKQYQTTLERIDKIKKQQNQMGPPKENAMQSLKLIQFRALFNQARLYGEKRDIPNALKFYQEALNIQPHSKKVKENIEMLWLANSNQNQSSKKQEKENQKKDQNKKDQKTKKEGQKPEEEEKKNPNPAQDPDQEKNENQNEKSQTNENNKEQNQNKDDKNKEEETQLNSNPSAQKKEPQSFESKELKEDDVLRIFEEIKNQEKKIRAKEFEKNQKGKNNEKEW